MSAVCGGVSIYVRIGWRAGGMSVEGAESGRGSNGCVWCCTWGRQAWHSTGSLVGYHTRVCGVDYTKRCFKAALLELSLADGMVRKRYTRTWLKAIESVRYMKGSRESPWAARCTAGWCSLGPQHISNRVLQYA